MIPGANTSSETTSKEADTKQESIYLNRQWRSWMHIDDALESSDQIS